MLLGDCHLCNHQKQELLLLYYLYSYKNKHIIIENLVSGIDSQREKLSWSKDQERFIPGRCTITITICNSDDATQPITLDTNLKNHRKRSIT